MVQLPSQIMEEQENIHTALLPNARNSQAMPKKPPTATDKPLRGPGGFLPTAGRYITSRTFEADCEFDEKVLGSGVSGDVRLAVCKKTGKTFAVKSFRKKQLRQDRLGDMRREIDVHMFVDHPHICRLERAYESDELVHLVMEKLEGGELFDRLIERKQFAEEAAAQAIRQVLLSVAYLHAHLIVHRDLKLENVMFEKKGGDSVKLIDFGFATKWNGRTKMSQRCGTLHYAAPEVLVGAYTEKADMWSIGTMVYMLLTGKALYMGEENIVQRKVRAGKVDYSKNFNKLSPEARDFVQSLLIVDPLKRLGAMNALQHPWIRKHTKLEPISASTIQCLRSFSQTPHLRRACLVAMAWAMSREDEAGLRSQFCTLDVDGDGVIALGELKRGLKTTGDKDLDECEVLFKNLTGGYGDLTYREFLAATMQDRWRNQNDPTNSGFAPAEVKVQATVGGCLSFLGALGCFSFLTAEKPPRRAIKAS